MKMHMDALDVGDCHVENAGPHYVGDCNDYQDNDCVRVGHDCHSHRVRAYGVRVQVGDVGEVDEKDVVDDVLSRR